MALSSAMGGGRGSPSQSSPLVETGSSAPKKRPRPVLSCIECRKKKLKCDRLLPCNQCNRADKITQCVYQNRETLPTQPQLTSDGSESELGPSRKKISRVPPVIPLVPQNSAPDQLPAPLIDQNEKSGVLEELQSRVEKLERILSAHPQPHTQTVSQECSRPSKVCSRFCLSFLICIGPFSELYGILPIF